jgi:hypothetical protein
MSSRLVILRHKKWNVWNPDNRERVLRDERLHKESLEQAQVTERLHTQDKIYESLTKKNDGSKEGNVEPFRLFADIEAREKKKGNDEYAKEKEEKRLAELKRENIAPWELGEGSLEKTSVKPFWYSSDARSNVVSKGKLLNGNDAIEAKSRDEKRKRDLDPMAYHFIYDETPSNSTNYTTEKKRSDSISSSISSSSESSSEKKHKKKKHKRKKDSKKKKHKR